MVRIEHLAHISLTKASLRLTDQHLGNENAVSAILLITH